MSAEGRAGGDPGALLLPPANTMRGSWSEYRMDIIVVVVNNGSVYM